MRSISLNIISVPPLSLLIAISIIVIVAVATSLIRGKRYQKRVESLGSKNRPTGIRQQSSRNILRKPQGQKRPQVERIIAELEAQQKTRVERRQNPPLVVRLRQAGLSWNKLQYYAFAIVAGLLTLAGAYASGLHPTASVGFGIFGALFLPNFYVKLRRNRRLKSFEKEFPKAVGIMLRGLKSGLPLIDCLRIVSRDTKDPVKHEFQSVVDDQALGVPLTDAITRLAERVPSTDLNFLSIVISIQSKSGGSLSEALQNLADTLAERRKIKEKIKAMSQEAKSSAAIIGALPFFVAGALYVISPEYIALLYTETNGQIVVACSALWMTIGILVMKKMVNFEL